LAHYQVRGADKAIYETEYICPFTIGPSEIVDTWAWRRIEKWMLQNRSDFEGWVKMVGIPAYEEHERVRKGGKPVACVAGCKCCGH